VDAQIKLSVVASDIFGVSGRAMLAALLAGERDPKRLAQLARARMRAKRSLLAEAFTGFFTDHHGFLLARMLDRIDALSADIAALDARIEALIGPFAQTVDRLDEIPGLGQTAAHLLIAEIGVDTGPVPNRWAPGLVGQVRPGRQPVRRQAQGHRHHRARQPLPRPGAPGRPPWLPGGPIPSLGSATGGSLADAAPTRRSSRSAGPS
jgi:transposase